MEYYTIKEASQMLCVETHVLRYWEEELGLSIKRNDMGHRYYASKNMQMFREIQKLKEQGFSLKNIRTAIESYQRERERKLEGEESESEKGSKETNVMCRSAVEEEEKENNTQGELSAQVVEFKTAQLQSIMNRVVANALRDNKDIIKDSIKGEVVKDVIHQFDMIMRENEEREEERFHKLDEALRKLQQANEEVAATRMKKHRWRKNR